MSEMPERLQAARLRLSSDRPYLCAALWALHPVSKPGLGTLAVDRWWRLYYDPEVQWPVTELAGVLYHEVSHLLRDHPGRAENIAGLDSSAWNLCADAEINDDLIAERVPLPNGCITPQSLKQAPGLLAEEYYNGLPAVTVKASSASSSVGDPARGQCGSCAGGEQRPYEDAPPDGNNNKPGGATPGVSAAEAELIRRQVANEVQAHASRGTVPSWLKRWAEELLHPRVDWRRVLRGLIRHAIADVAGMTDYTYARPSRRQSAIPHVVMPALRQPTPSVAVVVDTSGSMGQELLDAALAEVSGVLRACGQSHGVEAIVCDAHVHSARRVFRASQISLAGGGGTDMRVGIEAAVRSRRPHAVIVITDGHTPWPNAPLSRTRVIAALLGQSAPQPPDWIKSVTVDVEAR